VQATVLQDHHQLQQTSGAGVPVYATRGPRGGFRLLDTVQRTVQTLPAGLVASRGQLRRVRVRIAPAALQLALVNGRPEGWRPRPHFVPADDRPDWIEGSFRFDSYESATYELLTLAPDIEVLLPVELRTTMASIGRRVTRLHRQPPRVAD
jgi:predicted DNA-binding transcriptional regulator YafY